MSTALPPSPLLLPRLGTLELTPGPSPVLRVSEDAAGAPEGSRSYLGDERTPLTDALGGGKPLFDTSVEEPEAIVLGLPSLTEHANMLRQPLHSALSRSWMRTLSFALSIVPLGVVSLTAVAPSPARQYFGVAGLALSAVGLVLWAHMHGTLAKMEVFAAVYRVNNFLDEAAFGRRSVSRRFVARQRLLKRRANNALNTPHVPLWAWRVLRCGLWVAAFALGAGVWTWR